MTFYNIIELVNDNMLCIIYILLIYFVELKDTFVI